MDNQLSCKNTLYVCEHCKITFTIKKNLDRHRKLSCSKYKMLARDKKSNSVNDTFEIQINKIEAENSELKKTIFNSEVTINELQKKITELQMLAITDLRSNDIIYYLDTNNIYPHPINITDSLYLEKQFKNDMALACHIASMNDVKKVISWIVDYICYIYQKENPREQQIWSFNAKDFVIRYFLNGKTNWKIDKKGIIIEDLIIKRFLNHLHNVLIKSDICAGFADEIKVYNQYKLFEKEILSYLENVSCLEFETLVKNKNDSATKFINDNNIQSYEELEIVVNKLKEFNDFAVSASVKNAIDKAKYVQKVLDQVILSLNNEEIHDIVMKKIHKRFVFSEHFFEYGTNTIKRINTLTPQEIMRNRIHRQEALKEYEPLSKKLTDDMFLKLEKIKTYTSNYFFGIKDATITDIDITIINKYDNYDEFGKYIASVMHNHIKKDKAADNFLWNISNFGYYFVYRTIINDDLIWREDFHGDYVQKHFIKPTLKLINTKLANYKDNKIAIEILKNTDKFNIIVKYFFSKLIIFEL